MNKMPDASGVKDAHAEQEAKVKSSLQKIKNKFIVMSGKGGVGKTSVSVNKALETII
jgi:Mrp family chromosome partitioning ATPase